MIGRGTRLRPDLFGLGQDKEHFLIFDFCQNFEFFDQNPDVAEVALADSIGRRLFVARVELIGEIDRAEPDGMAPSDQGEVDLRGTLGVDPDAPVGFESIRLRLEVDAPGASAEQLERLMERTERYCTVLQTLREAPSIQTTLVAT